MFISLNWVKKYTDLPVDLSMEQLAYDLTMRTVEVEGWHNPKDSYAGVVIGEILSVQSHPDADLLRICQVDVGQAEPLQIVCGGSNLYEHELVVVAAPGAMVRWHGQGEPVEIKPAQLRGVDSYGMICAANELDLDDLFPARDEHEIMDLSAFPGAKVGAALTEVLDLDDFILDIDNKSLTNRPDLWGHYGIARELAAIYGTSMKDLPQGPALPTDLPAYRVDIADEADCPRYLAAVIQDVANEPSPYELKKYLHLIGHSSHGLLVDISNFVMYGLGQPNHTYDRQQVGDTISVRRAQEGENLLLLEDISLKLDPEDIVIASDQHAIGLAGIKGGLHDSILPETHEIVLEIANFDPHRIRKTDKKYAVHTEAAARFEKGLSVESIDPAFDYFLYLLHRYQPQAKVVAFTDQGSKRQAPLEITCQLAHLQDRLGKELTAEEMARLLAPLGFQVVPGKPEEITWRVPYWRATGDVEGEADLVEEIARMIGYENFPFVAPAIHLDRAVQSNLYTLDQKLRTFLAANCGLQEVYTYPWVEESYQRLCGYPDAASIEIFDAPSPEEKYLQQSLLPGLLAVAKRNEGYAAEFSLFNSAMCFKKRAQAVKNAGGESLPEQKQKLGVLCFGQDPHQLFRKVKGIWEALIRTFDFVPFALEQVDKPQWSDPQAWANIVAPSGSRVGDLGLVSAYVLEKAGFKRGYIALLEFSLDCLHAAQSESLRYHAIPEFPLVEMDFTVLCPEGVRWQDISRYIAKRVVSVEFVGEYRGKQVPEGKKSITFRVNIGKSDGTLSREEIDQQRNSLLNTLKHTVGAEIRDF